MSTLDRFPLFVEAFEEEESESFFSAKYAPLSLSVSLRDCEVLLPGTEKFVTTSCFGKRNEIRLFAFYLSLFLSLDLSFSTYSCFHLQVSLFSRNAKLASVVNQEEFIGHFRFRHQSQRFPFGLKKEETKLQNKFSHFTPSPSHPSD
jgi:hypothetical protein